MELPAKRKTRWNLRKRLLRKKFKAQMEQHHLNGNGVEKDVENPKPRKKMPVCWLDRCTIKSLSDVDYFGLQVIFIDEAHRLYVPVSVNRGLSAHMRRTDQL